MKLSTIITTNFTHRCIVSGTFLAVYLIINIFYDFLAGENPSNLSLSQLAEGVSKEYTWALRLTINCIGYSALLIPGVLIYKYTKKTKYLERSGKNFDDELSLISLPHPFRTKLYVCSD
jgi:hypothetical protein